MSPYDLIQMINRNSRTTRETIETVNDLIAEIDNNPKKFLYQLSKDIEDFSLKIRKCPLCGGDIVQIDKESEESEYFGRPVSEDGILYGCDDCNYIVG